MFHMKNPPYNQELHHKVKGIAEVQKTDETISLCASNSTITKFVKYKLDLSLVDLNCEILVTSNALVITFNEIVDISELAAKPPPMTSFLQWISLEVSG